MARGDSFQTSHNTASLGLRKVACSGRGGWSERDVYHTQHTTSFCLAAVGGGRVLKSLPMFLLYSISR